MNADFDKDKVLGRIKKMMALANDAGASEGERDNALRMAHATLAKYNLSMAEADAVGTTPEEKRMGGAMELREHPWMRTVAQAIGKLYFCHFFYTALGNNRVKYTFIGRESNIYTAQEMTRYVIKSIDDEARRVAKRETGNPSGTYWRSFCKGAAHRVYVRCVEIQKSAEAAPSTGTSLVLASVYQLESDANKRYVAEVLNIKLRTGANRQRGAAWDAFAAGKEYGGRVGLHTQVGTRSAGNAKLIK